MTFHAKINGIQIIVSMLYSDFRNGTVGSAEGEKFAQACAPGKTEKTSVSCLHTHDWWNQDPGRDPWGDPNAKMHHGGERIH